MMRTQHNAWPHACATLLVVGAGLSLRVSLSDWRWLIAAIA
jgi:diacylglycerol kinase (ATP)